MKSPPPFSSEDEDRCYGLGGLASPAIARRRNEKGGGDERRRGAITDAWFAFTAQEMVEWYPRYVWAPDWTNPYSETSFGTDYVDIIEAKMRDKWADRRLSCQERIDAGTQLKPRKKSAPMERAMARALDRLGEPYTWQLCLWDGHFRADFALKRWRLIIELDDMGHFIMRKYGTKDKTPEQLLDGRIMRDLSMQDFYGGPMQIHFMRIDDGVPYAQYGKKVLEMIEAIKANTTGRALFVTHGDRYGCPIYTSRIHRQRLAQPRHFQYPKYWPGPITWPMRSPSPAMKEPRSAALELRMLESELESVTLPGEFPPWRHCFEDVSLEGVPELTGHSRDVLLMRIDTMIGRVRQRTATLEDAVSLGGALGSRWMHAGMLKAFAKTDRGNEARSIWAIVALGIACIECFPAVPRYVRLADIDRIIQRQRDPETAHDKHIVSSLGEALKCAMGGGAPVGIIGLILSYDRDVTGIHVWRDRHRCLDAGSMEFEAGLPIDLIADTHVSGPSTTARSDYCSMTEHWIREAMRRTGGLHWVYHEASARLNAWPTTGHVQSRMLMAWLIGNAICELAPAMNVCAADAIATTPVSPLLYTILGVTYLNVDADTADALLDVAKTIAIRVDPRLPMSEFMAPETAVRLTPAVAAAVRQFIPRSMTFPPVICKIDHTGKKKNIVASTEQEKPRTERKTPPRRGWTIVLPPPRSGGGAAAGAAAGAVGAVAVAAAPRQVPVIGSAPATVLESAASRREKRRREKSATLSGPSTPAPELAAVIDLTAPTTGIRPLKRVRPAVVDLARDE
jgi:hypothetical protein